MTGSLGSLLPASIRTSLLHIQSHIVWGIDNGPLAIKDVQRESFPIVAIKNNIYLSYILSFRLSVCLSVQLAVSLEQSGLCGFNKFRERYHHKYLCLEN